MSFEQQESRLTRLENKAFIFGSDISSIKESIKGLESIVKDSIKVTRKMFDEKVININDQLRMFFNTNNKRMENLENKKEKKATVAIRFMLNASVLIALGYGLIWIGEVRQELKNINEKIETNEQMIQAHFKPKLSGKREGLTFDKEGYLDVE